MTTDSRNIDYVKTLHLKKVGLALAGLWVIIFIAAASATIYREFDGPTIRSMIVANQELSSANSTLNGDLKSARTATEAVKDQLSLEQTKVDRLAVRLADSRSDYADLISRLESYLTSVPLIQISP